MDRIAELRDAKESALERWEKAVEALDSPAEDADVESLTRDCDEAEAEHRTATERLARAEKVSEARKNAPVEAVEETPTPEPEVRVGKEPLTYERHNGKSIFADLHNASTNQAAAQRLQRHQEEMIAEKRTDPHTLTNSEGGYLVAPLYLQNEYVDYARADRVAADVLGSRPLPPNTNSVNIPAALVGVSVDRQSTENNTIDQTDPTFQLVTGAVGTIAGYNDVSQQLVDRGVPGIDDIIYADLVKAYNAKLDSKVLGDTTTNCKGITEVSSTNSVTYTDASPTVAELYPKIADAIQQIHTNIFMAPDAILMHPRRWAWLLSAVDGSNRPLITPYAPQNAAGSFGGVVSEGAVGSIQGLPVYVDANVVSTDGTTTDQDEIYVIRTDELFLYEDQSGPYLETFREPGSATLTVRFRLFNYWTQIFGRRPKAISVVSGTGLRAPTF